MRTDQLRTRFQLLVDEHRKIVYKICNSYCSNPDDRDDLAQEIVAEAWRSFPTFEERSRFATWLYRIALNVAISYNRRETRRHRHVVVGQEHLLDVAGEVRAEPEGLLLLRQFIEELDPLNKALILLHLDGYGYREVGDVLGITETNVATKLSRLKTTLRRHFSTADKAQQQDIKRWTWI